MPDPDRMIEGARTSAQNQDHAQDHAGPHRGGPRIGATPRGGEPSPARAELSDLSGAGAGPLVNAPPFACPFCGEERLLEGDARAWMCQVCGQHGPRALRAVATMPASPGAWSAADLAALIQHHLPGPWQVVTVAPLAQWPRSLQQELTRTLSASTDTVVLVLERMPQ